MKTKEEEIKRGRDWWWAEMNTKDISTERFFYCKGRVEQADKDISHISKIRKDDIDGLVEELKKRREETKKHLSERGSCLLCIEEDYCFHEIQRDTFSDIIDHLQAQKEKV